LKKNNRNRWIAWLIVVIYWSLLIIEPVYPQTTKVDSLIQALEEHSEIGQERISLLKQLVPLLRNNSLDRTKQYAGELEVLGAKLNDDQAQFTAKMALGTAIFQEGSERDRGMQYFQEALALTEAYDTREWKIKRGQVFINIAGAHLFTGKPQLSVNYLPEAISVFEQVQDTLRLSDARRAYAIAYQELDRPDSAIQQLQLAIEGYRQLGDDAPQGMALITLGRLWEQKEAPQPAIEAYNDAVAILLLQNQPRYRISGYDGLHRIYSNQKDFRAASIALDSFLAVAERSGREAQVTQYSLKLARLYQQRELYDSAYFALDNYLDAWRTFNNEEQLQRINELEVQYQTQKKERENQLLRQQNRIYTLRNRLFLALTVAAFLLLAMLGFFYHSLRQKNRQIEQANQNSQRLNREKRQLISLIAHDIQTPVSLIRMNLHRDEPEVEPTQEELSEIDLAAKNVSDLTRKIIEIENFEDQPPKMPLYAVDLQPIIKGQIDLLTPIIQSQRMRVTTELEDCPPILGNTFYLERVISNLLNNALSYSPKGGPIDIHTRSDNGKLEIRIRNSGKAIPAGDREKVFEKFYRIDGEEKENTPHFGMGLYLSRILMRAMSGAIRLDAQEGAGSTFIIELGLAKNGIQEEAASKS